MATELKLRRGTTSQHSSFTGAESEVTVDTDKNTVVVHDGATAGGFPLLRENASSGLPTIKPSLNLDFANTKSLDPRIDFTRASTATYYDEQGILRTAAPNEPRFDHDPDTGESKGLLIEEQRTNLLTYSEDVSQWNAPGAVTVTTNVAVAPDATTTADLVEGATDTTWLGNNVFQPCTINENTEYSFTFWLKSAGATSITVRLRDNSPTTVIQVEVTPTSAWKRIEVTGATFAGATTLYPIVGGADGGFYIWGAQLEEGEYPTSYIPTTDSQVTRVRDSAVGTVPEANPKEGVYLVSTLMAPYTFFNAALGFGDGNSEEFRLGQEGTNEPQVVYRAAGVQTTFSGDGVTLGDYYKVALSYREESDGSVTITGYANGQLLGSGPLPRLPNDFDSFRVGSRGHGGGLEWNESIKRVTCYPRALPNTVLQALTEE